MLLSRKEQFMGKIMAAKKLFPPLTDSVVVGYSFGEGEIYPVVSWAPMQEGAGDPSPENIRPISGRESVEVTRCGENLLNVIADETIDYVPDGFMAGVGPYPIDKPYMLIGVASSGYWTVKAISSYQLDNGQLTALTTSNGYGIGFNVNCTPNTEYIFHCAEMSGKPYYSAIFLDKYGYYIKAVSFNNLHAFTMPDGCYNLVIIYRPYPGENAAIKDIQLELGATPTTYAPYTGVTRTLTLPSTIYGGAVDVGTGAGVETWGYATISSVQSASVLDAVVRGATTIPHESPLAKNGNAISSYLPEKVDFVIDMPSFYTNQRVVYVRIAKSMLTTPDMDGLNAYLAAHPLDIAYKLAEPVPFQATGGAQIPALAGCNTLMTDADKIELKEGSDIFTEADIEDIEPISREEQFLDDIIQGRVTPTLEPISRKEEFLAGMITGKCSVEPISREECAIYHCINGTSMQEEPISRVEQLWNIIGGT